MIVGEHEESYRSYSNSNYILATLALFMSLVIYVIFRSKETIVNQLIDPIFLGHLFTHIRGLELPGWVIYSLPGGLWVFSAVFLSKGDFFYLMRYRIEAIYIPLVVGLGIEFSQLIHLTNGTFDWIDLIVVGVCWIIAYLLQRRQVIHHNTTRPVYRNLLLFFCYGILVLADVVSVSVL